MLLPGAGGIDPEPGVPFRGGQLRLHGHAKILVAGACLLAIAAGVVHFQRVGVLQPRLLLSVGERLDLKWPVTPVNRGWS